MNHRIVTLCLMAFVFSVAGNRVMAKELSEKDSVTLNMPKTPIHKIYVASGLDGAIFSTATVQRPYRANTWGTLRFTYFINYGLTFNYDFSNFIGAYAGLDLKNIGFIEKRKDTTIKHRTYDLGIPVGVKIGNMKDRFYGFAGGGVETPINYREKAFVNRGDKQKFNEFFSDRTSHILPYIFAGVSVKPGVSLKLQYYLTNYMNPDFQGYDRTKVYGKPYAGYDVHLFLISIGVNMPYSKPKLYDKDIKNESHDDDDTDQI